MFNFTPKPLISLDNTTEVFNRTIVEERTRNNNTKQDETSSNSELQNKMHYNLQADAKMYGKIYSAYDDVLQEAENDQESSTCSNLSKQIIRKLGAEVQTIFKLSKLIDFHQNQNNTRRRGMTTETLRRVLYSKTNLQE
ncbi:unnamed protein product [Paramecium octaurelia]|nr:unnamed protein product [Paramecium octaurelia]